MGPVIVIIASYEIESLQGFYYKKHASASALYKLRGRMNTETIFATCLASQKDTNARSQFPQS